MENNRTFKDRYALLFIKVCDFMGDGWRVDMLEDGYDNRIKLTAPNLRRYAIHARQEKDRIVLTGYICRRYYPYGQAVKCTVSLNRSPGSIATDIKRKILPSVAEKIYVAEDYNRKQQEKNEHIKIVKNMLARQVTLTDHYQALTGFDNGRGIRGDVTDDHRGYGLKFSGLSTEQLIKVVGFISTL